MVDFDQIEALKRQYTDKYVVVDERRPELTRFRGQTGIVKTVNMSGRALVQFDGHLNVGWYDIELDFLKVIDAPLPKPVEAEAKAERKPVEKKAAPAAAAAGEKKLSPLEMARMQGAAKPAGATEKPKPGAGGKPSTADILAAARTKTAGGAPAAPKAAAPATEKPKPAAGGKPSTADILAAARANKGAAAAPSPVEARVAASTPPAATATKESATTTAEKLAAARSPKGAAAKPQPVAQAAVEKPVAAKKPVAEKSAAAAAAKASAAKATTGVLPTTTAEIIAWCRRVDAKS